MTTAGQAAGKGTYAGVFFIALASLMYEILLTRIFSVTTWYHFAFVALSIAMFGMSLGAILVYFGSRRLAVERTREYMAYSSILLGASVLLALYAQLRVPFHPDYGGAGLFSAIFTYGVISIPFAFSGICVCMALTRFPVQISRLYAADLAGAASGCALTILVLKTTDALTAVVLVALLALVAAGWLAADAGARILQKAAFIGCAALGAFVVANTIQVNRQHPLIRLRWVKEFNTDPPLYEKWNSYSRIAVTGDSNAVPDPTTEGTSTAYVPHERVRQLYLTIDGSAETTLTSYTGNVEGLDYLKDDAKEFVYRLRSGAKVLIIGAGGGRDILAALALRQNSVRAVEVNSDILRAVNGRFGDFTGHLDRNPRVTFVNDEARSYLARIPEQFDIIQASFIDTWAATAAGGFALTENGLYTTQAFKLFLRRLTPNGILSFSRWYFPNHREEAYRLVSLAAESLRQSGVPDPRSHLLLIANFRKNQDPISDHGACTLLISREPFSQQDLAVAGELAQELKFEILLSPQFAQDAVFEALATDPDLQKIAAGFSLDFSPPTDDRPFFFQMVRLRDILVSPDSWRKVPSWNGKAVGVLASLLMTVIILTGLTFIIPLGMRKDRPPLRFASPYFAYFAAIGLGYMLIEVSQMERLIVFLGNPAFALSVVLFTLLLASGAGSYATRNIGKEKWASAGLRRLAILLAVLLATGLVTDAVTARLGYLQTPERIFVSFALLFPMGFFMGMAFPLGMMVACEKSSVLTPWLWGINGATSVFASVLAVAIAMIAGISMAFWWGFGAYLACFAAFLWMRISNAGTRASG